MESFGLIVIFGFLTVLICANHHDKITISPATTQVVHYINDSHIVLCNYPPEMEVKWKSPKGEIIKDKKGRLHVEEKSPGQLALVFEHISLADKGEWSCASEKTDDKKSFKMITNQPISFMDTPIIQSAQEGKDANIRCEVKGDPEPTVSWSFNGQAILPPNTKFTKLADGLLVKNVSKNDSGEYTCRAFQVSEIINDVKEQTILLKILHKPISPSHKNRDIQYGYVNGIVNLTCEAIAEPHANFTWIRHGKKLSPRTHNIYHGNHTSMLQVFVSDEKVFGLYKCKATNEYGSLERQIELTEGTKPDPPSQVSLRGVNSDTFDIDVGAVRTSATPNAMDVNGYRFELIPEDLYREKGGKWDAARILEFGFEDGVTFLINNLTPNTTYLVRVASKNPAGLSDWTETKKFLTYPKEPMMTSSSAFLYGNFKSFTITVFIISILFQLLDSTLVNYEFMLKGKFLNDFKL